MNSNEVIKLHKKAIKRAERQIATMTLQALRFCRDKSPTEWDELTKSESGPAMLDLWDYLKHKEQQECD